MAISSGVGVSAIKPGVVDSSATRPASPYEGQVIFQKDTDQLLVWNGTAWVIPNQTTQNPEGLELVKVQTIGTGVSSVTVSDVFSSTYDNYLVTLAGGSNSADNALTFKLGATTSGYYSQYIYTTWGNSVASDTITNAAHFVYAGSGNTNGLFMNLTVLAPNLPTYTRVSTSGSGQGTAYVGHYNGLMPNTTQYTSFIISNFGGTMTGGTIRVYGYRNS